MKRTVTRTLPLTTICAFVLMASPFFLPHTGLTRITPSANDLNFETSDRDDQLKDQQLGSESYLSNMFPFVLNPGTTHLEEVSHFASFSPLGRGIFSLRC